MEIVETWVPELVAVVFLVLPLLRPFIKRLWHLDGLLWLPLIALAILIGIFPAYGFRPECLPMLIMALILSIANVVPFALGASRSYDSFHDRRPFRAAGALILVVAAAVPMFAFSSRVNVMAKGEPVPVEEVKISHSTGDYFLRIYGEVQANRPVILLIPPEIGSSTSINLVCAELYKNNYTVVTYFFRDGDPVRRFLSFPAKLFRHWRILRMATVFASVHEQGKLLEDERRAEVELLLSVLPWNDNLPPMFLVGYGAAGSALAYLAGENGFASRYNAVQGVVAIESRLWSSYLPEPRVAGVIPVADTKLRIYWAIISNYLNSMKPQRVSRSGPLPSDASNAESSERKIPVLYLTSGRALDASKGQRPYQAVFDTLRSGSGPVVFAAIDGAGPLDFQDYPLTHPAYSFLFPGLKGAQKSDNPVEDTANILNNFASALLEQADYKQPPRLPVNGLLYVESKGLPGFRL